ncbi:MAG: eukaryotic-like serine/threonine-protein kinase [Solirubrobacteraceae bacterium]|nr:eukaryotic-like serine/threonine-protein kinase [Solirubrobacteraceae bacterium]
MLRVRLFGGLALEFDRSALDAPASRRARELLAWLALHPGRHARAALAARFWPEVLDESARASLRTTLHELRRALGDAGECLVADRDAVALDAAWVDAREVEALLAAGRADEALALGDGELLAGIETDWVLAARDDFRERMAARLGVLAVGAEADGDRAAAVRWSRAQVALDPLSEERARALIRRLAAAGDRGAALAVYERLRERLRADLRTAPSAETRAVADELRSTAPTAAAPEAMEIPGLVRRAVTGPFVGRDEALERLVAALGRAALGERRLVLVGGEPGIGKTRLMAELCARAHAGGATVRFGRCFEEAIAPYQPFVEALGDAWPHDAPHTADDAAGARWRLFESVDAALRTRAPTVLALDDLHWADNGSLLLLAHMVRATRPTALLLVGTYRESELSRTHPLAATLADLRREGLYERISLDGLGAADVAELLRVWLGSDARAATLHEETAGNPFFLEEVVLHLRESGSDAGIPESIREVLGRRLSRLSDGANRALQAAAVVGRDFDVALLERLDALTGIDALEAVEEAAAAQLVREDGARPARYGFSHPLVRETVYQELSLTRRVRLHSAVADALEALYGDDPSRLNALATHRLAAAAGTDPERAVEIALRAGRHCIVQLAYEDATATANAALEALAQNAGALALRTDVLLLRGEALLRCGDDAGARGDFGAAAALAREAGDPERLARAALGASGLGVTIIAVDESVVALLREALAGLPEPGALRARLLARLAVETYYASSPPQRKAIGDEAVRVAQRSLDPAALVSALNARRVALWSAAYLAERLETGSEMVRAAEGAGDAEGVLQGRNWRVADLLEMGDIAACREEVERHEHLADRLRLPAYQWWGSMWRSTLAIAVGSVDDAERLIADFAALGARTGDRNALLYVEIQRFVLAMMGFGDPPPVDALERERDRPADYAYRAGLAWYRARQGRADEARDLIAWIAADDWARLADDMNRLAALAEMSQAMALTGDPTWAAGAYERLAPYADRNIVNARGAAGYGSAALHLGQLAALRGRPEEAAAHLRDAIARNAAMGADVWRERAKAALDAVEG